MCFSDLAKNAIDVRKYNKFTLAVVIFNTPYIPTRVWPVGATKR